MTPTTPHSHTGTLLAPLAPWGVWAALAAAGAYVLAFNPTDTIADLSGRCVWHALFGIDGPGCGGTRMYWHLLHGNLIQATRHHLPGLIGLLYGLYALTVWTLSTHTRLRPPLWRPTSRTIAIYIALWLLYTIVNWKRVQVAVN